MCFNFYSQHTVSNSQPVFSNHAKRKVQVSLGFVILRQKWSQFSILSSRRINCKTKILKHSCGCGTIFLFPSNYASHEIQLGPNHTKAKAKAKAKCPLMFTDFSLIFSAGSLIFSLSLSLSLGCE